MVSAVMWRPYLVSELSTAFKVFGACTFISFKLVSDIYVQRMAIRGSITAHIDFSNICYLVTIQKNHIENETLIDNVGVY